MRAFQSRASVVLAVAATLLIATIQSALAAVTVTTSGTWRELAVPSYHQEHGLTCEAATLRMLLASLGIQVSESTLMSQIGVDGRPPTFDQSGAMHWGDPYANFVGNPDGAERLLTGYGVYYPPIARVAQMDGASIAQAGEGIVPSTIYQAVAAGHPVMAWVSFDWIFHQVTHYVAFDGRTVQFGSPYEHTVAVVGVTDGDVLVNNPWFGVQWINKAVFESSYATFNQMAVIAGGAAIGPAAPSSATAYQGATPVPQDSYQALTPARILDTRTGVGAPAAPLGSGGHLDAAVAGQGGVPSSGVDAVALNVTVTNPTGLSYLTLYPTGMGPPLASNLNWHPAQTVTNLVTVAVGTGGRVSVFNAAGTADVIIDLQGWFGPAAAGAHDGLFNGLTPVRILDTRVGIGASGKVGARQVLALPVVGHGGVSPSGVSAVVLNVTATNPTTDSYLTVYPSSGSQPLASNLNFVGGQTSANRVIARVGSDGKIRIYNAAGSVDVIVDVSGWFTDPTNPNGGSRFAPIAPGRVLDTRGGFGTVPPSATGTIQFADSASIGVTAVVANVTAVGASDPSYLTMWPGASGRPVASDLNYTTGQTVPNLVIAVVGSNSTVDFFNAAGTVDLVIDLAGYFGPVGP